MKLFLSLLEAKFGQQEELQEVIQVGEPEGQLRAAARGGWQGDGWQHTRQWREAKACPPRLPPAAPSRLVCIKTVWHKCRRCSVGRAATSRFASRAGGRQARLRCAAAAAAAGLSFATCLRLGHPPAAAQHRPCSAARLPCSPPACLPTPLPAFLPATLLQTAASATTISTRWMCQSRGSGACRVRVRVLVLCAWHVYGEVGWDGGGGVACFLVGKPG